MTRTPVHNTLKSAKSDNTRCTHCGGNTGLGAVVGTHRSRYTYKQSGKRHIAQDCAGSMVPWVGIALPCSSLPGGVFKAGYASQAPQEVSLRQDVPPRLLLEVSLRQDMPPFSF